MSENDERADRLSDISSTRARAAREADRDPRRRPRGPHRRLPAGQAGPARCRARGREPGRRHRQDRGARRLPLRPRRPPLLHQGEGGRRPLARDHEGGVPRAPAHVADLLARPPRRGQVPRLPAARPGRDEEARPGRPDQGALLLPLGGGQAQGQGGDLRGVGLEPLRPLPLQPVLQVLHREGLGRARPPRSAPTGPPSASRTCPSSAPRGPPSSATGTTRSRASSPSSTTRATARARCGSR